MKTLRLILGDQLNYKHSWFSKKDECVYYLIIELKQENEYVRHHIQKIIGFFAAMYNFANYLKKNGHQVIHVTINNPENKASLAENLNHQIKKHQFEKFEYLLPDEFRLDEQLTTFCKQLTIPFAVDDTEHFFTTRTELARFFDSKKNYLLENFYRYLRKKEGILMKNDKPIGDKWNFDAANRNAYKEQDKLPKPFLFLHDYSTIFEEIQKAGLNYFGNSHASSFFWPTTRKQALELMHYFNLHFLPHFGKYQDAMHTSYWSLFHSRLSFAMNIKLISPHEVVQSAVTAWEINPVLITIEQVEGYVRQILGWREYMRGVYWAKMPDYSKLNFFQHTRKLPEWFWTGKTKMNCLQNSITQSLDFAYAHHIQRLMVTGNFALLAGIHPDETDKWYLGIYIDAIEWVEITNTRGMSQYADGGIVGSKPYVSSANYIDKMSNYCKSCQYDKRTKTEKNSCPFNSLYWNFYHSNREKLANNPRIGMMYKVWDKFTANEQKSILEKAQQYLSDIENI